MTKQEAIDGFNSKDMSFKLGQTFENGEVVYQISGKNGVERTLSRPGYSDFYIGSLFQDNVPVSCTAYDESILSRYQGGN